MKVRPHCGPTVAAEIKKLKSTLSEDSSTQVTLFWLNHF